MFLHEMEKRIHEKQRNGWTGWNDKVRFSDANIKKRINDNLGRGDYVDAANLAMILWAREYTRED